LASKNDRKSIQPQVAAPPVPATTLGGGFGRDLANWLFPAYLVMIVAGFFAIWKYGSPPGNPNPVRALFLAMNSATLSGFTEGSGVGALNQFGQWAAFFLIVGGSLFTMIVGGLAVIRIVRLPFTDAELIWSAFIVEAVVLLVGSSLLWEVDRPPFESMFLAGSSFGNCGQYVADPSRVSTELVHAIILPLSILGGLGLPVLMELWCAIVFRAKLSVHSKTVLAASAWLYVIGLVLVLVLSFNGPGLPTWTNIRNQIPTSSVLSVESRTGGLAIAAIKDVPLPATWILVVLMMIGASPAGTGSGLKTTTIAELILGVRKLLRGQTPGRPFAIAFVWLAIYLGLLLGAMLLLSHVSGSDSADNILFDAVSAMSNVGFTAVPVADQKSVMFAYCAIVLVGRMAPLMVLWWMAETTSDADLAIG
jgi:trk system potassium uptake protein TrkH